MIEIKHYYFFKKFISYDQMAKIKYYFCMIPSNLLKIKALQGRVLFYVEVNLFSPIYFTFYMTKRKICISSFVKIVVTLHTSKLILNF